MKKLTIETISGGSVHLLTDQNKETAATCRADETSLLKAKQYAGELTLAYNHTYGLDINPRDIPQMIIAIDKSLLKIDGNILGDKSNLIDILLEVKKLLKTAQPE